ncbi:MAG: hypothetical protein A2Y38_16030 [Spirochaetes bacterium GWB1_59_5]|nr:MAG: hypothetical protein A2Y38_16030 [Spirochaetes bacterium GWB1_59_5]
MKKDITTTVMAALIALLSLVACLYPQLDKRGSGPERITSIRGEQVTLHGYGPYRHMPADVAVQGIAQDLFSLAVGIPLLIVGIVVSKKSVRGKIFLTGVVGYFLVQYFMYLGMGTYNELFLLWAVLLFLSLQTFIRLALGLRDEMQSVPAKRRYVSVFLIANGLLMAALWLQVILEPLLQGSLYPVGLAHFTTMIVQGYDLAIFLPPSIMAGWAYGKGRKSGLILAPVYSVFLSLQMANLLSKIVGMSLVGAAAGPALVVIPVLLAGAVKAAALSLGNYSARVPVALATA